MSFVKMPDKTANKNSAARGKKKYFKWIPGVHKIQLLDKDGIDFTYVHWVNNAYVKCLGKECPVCQENFRIMEEAKHSDTDYRKHKGFHPRTVRYYANILDLTPVKKCPKCGAEIHKREDGTWPDACSECGNLIVSVEPEPSMQVKILSKGKQLFGQFNSFEEIYGKPPTEYLIALVVKDSRDVSASALPSEEVVTEIPEELYNLPDDAVVTLTKDEMIQIMNGVKLRDILVARSANTKQPQSDIKSAVDALLED